MMRLVLIGWVAKQPLAASWASPNDSYVLYNTWFQRFCDYLASKDHLFLDVIIETL